jgi:hypothetical protein
MAMVWTLFVCVGLMYPKAKTSPGARSGEIDQRDEAVTPAVAHRRAA